MAVDTTAKALDLASEIVRQSGVLMDAVRELVKLKEEKERSGIDFEPGGTPMDFTGTLLKHVNGTNVNNAITSAIALKTWLDTEFHSDNFDHVHT